MDMKHMIDPTDEEFMADLTRSLASEGQIIEAGWMGFRAAAIPEAGESQVDDMRMAFFAGAQHLFTTIMVGFTEGDEVTEADETMLEKIDGELRAFLDEFKRKHGIGEVM